MEDYNKILESLGVRYIKSQSIKVIRPFMLDNFYDVENHLILLTKGEIYFGSDLSGVVKEGEILFIPGGKSIKLSYGSQDAGRLKNEEFLNKKEEYININPAKDTVTTDGSTLYNTVSFEAKVYDSVNFFTSLDIPAFVIKGGKEISESIKEIESENQKGLPGKDRFIKNCTERLVIQIVRYILDHRLFVEQLATNTAYFRDPRLINIFTYIKDHLEGDLSNQILSAVANVSEDYVGQYFKMLTGINPQDYIEYQRMEQAIYLLRTTKSTIRDISRLVGYKDTAYFCRRFKMMFGIPAGKMRRRESLMNI